MLNREEFVFLLEKYVSGNLSPEERSELFSHIQSGEFDDLVLQHIDNKLLTTNTENADLAPHRSADILHKILQAEKQNAILMPGPSPARHIKRWVMAAAATGIIFLATFLFVNRNNSPATSNIIAATELKHSINTSAGNLKITLEDGSVITLQPGAGVHYPKHFLPDKREVELDGEAFFEITKNPARPFFVYYKNIVTHVLGTSFNIKMNAVTHQLEVAVRTGRVEVYEHKTLQKDNNAKTNNGVVLTPNQKVSYDEVNRQFIPSLVDIPVPVIATAINTKPVTESLVFEETSLKKVLGGIEKTYGIEIVVETDNIYNCLFTGDLTDHELYTQLDIICQSVQASYEIKGTRILIKGKGCAANI